MIDPKIQAVIDAARLYSQWANDTGDYPHDPQGCKAHEAILAAICALDIEIVYYTWDGPVEPAFPDLLPLEITSDGIVLGKKPDDPQS